MPNGNDTPVLRPARHDTTPPSFRESDRTLPVQIALTYLGVGLLWAWLSSYLLAPGTQDGLGFFASAYRGSVFIFLSTPFVYWIVRRGFRDIDRANSLLRAIAEGTTDAVFVKDRNGKYLLFNQAAAGFVGRPVSDVLGRDDTALFGSASAALLMQRDQHVMALGLPETFEEVLTAAGETRVYLATKAPFRDESGAVVGVIGISRDITDRKRAESESREKEVFARSVLDSMNAHIAVLDVEGGIVAVNATWRLFAEMNSTPAGLAPRTGVGTNYLEICDESASQGCEEGERAATGIRQVLAGSTDRYTFEYPCHSPEMQRWFLMSVTRLDNGRGAVVTHTNISERKQSEQFLRFQHALLSSQAEASPDGILVVGPDNRIRLHNRRFLELWGIPEELTAAGNDAPVLELARSRAADPDGFFSLLAWRPSTPIRTRIHTTRWPLPTAERSIATAGRSGET